MREWANRSFFKIKKKTYIKHTKKLDFSFFSQNFFCESLICSFIMSELSELLTVTHFSWATWAIHSRSLICLERSEQITHRHSFALSKMSKWANERIPSPAKIRCDPSKKNPIVVKETKIIEPNGNYETKTVNGGSLAKGEKNWVLVDPILLPVRVEWGRGVGVAGVRDTRVSCTANQI